LFSRRGRFEIIHDILTLCLKPVQKTYIMYQANLSYTQLQKYLEYLVQIQLLEVRNVEEDTLYAVTEKGLNLIENYKKLLNILE